MFNYANNYQLLKTTVVLITALWCASSFTTRGAGGDQSSICLTQTSKTKV